ncbi:putative transcription factor C3H family [Medicago truncatula]|uniref:F-box and WD40 domain protein, putative n=1 Tax=Medicago truncatula TaxID=3880 RepID=A0A072TNK1_MEDTR|nr:uncharacterized protein LOC25500966 [Medicago truncatula]KEH18982.1 F-box and WD40 domain protein, putative [Medicago truncatula]RHN40075.1 putative transcription factor C3H family [Medicago truncatula]
MDSSGRTTKPTTINTTCTYWLAGRCNRNPCRFLHSLTPTNAAANTGYYNAARKRHFAYGPSTASSNAYTNTDAARKRHSSYVYDKNSDMDLNTKTKDNKDKKQVNEASLPKHNTEMVTKTVTQVDDASLPKHNTKKVLNTKMEDDVDSATQVTHASLPKHNTKTALNTKTGDNTNTAAQVTDASIAKHNTKMALNTKTGDDTHAAAQVTDASPPKHNTMTLLNTKTRDDINTTAQVTDACLPKHKTKTALNTKTGDGANAATLGHEKFITRMTIPDGSDKLYSGSSDGTLRTWDCQTGLCVNVMNLGAEITSLISKGPWIFVGLTNTVKAFHIPTSSQFTLDGTKGRVLAMTVANDTLGNDILLAGAEDGIISAWRSSSEANSPFKLVASLSGHTKSVDSLTVGGLKTLFSGSKDQTIKVWDLDTFECKMTLNAHTDAVMNAKTRGYKDTTQIVVEPSVPKHNTEIVFNSKPEGDDRDTRQVVEASLPKHNIETDLNRNRGRDQVIEASIPKHKTGDERYEAQVVEASVPKHNTDTVLKRKPEEDERDTRQVVEASLPKHNTGDENETQVVEASQNSSPSICKYWVNDSCVHGDQCQNLHSWFYGDGFATIAKLQGHKKLITGITIPNGSDKLYSGSTDGTLRTWDCRTGQCVNVTNLGTEVTSLISKGQWIFVGLPNTVKAWHIPTASQFTLDAPRGRVLAMTAGYDTLLAGAEDGVISAWRGNFKSNSPMELVASLYGHTKSVVCVTIGGVKTLYSGSKDQTIKLWDLDTFECTTTLNAHTDAVTSLICWDRYLLSGSSDFTIKVWYKNEEGALEVAYSHNVENGVVALSGMTDPDDKPIIFCSTRDNLVHLFEMPSFEERGRLFAKQEIGLVDIAPGGVFFTGDGTGLLTVWKWLEEYKVVASS